MAKHEQHENAAKFADKPLFSSAHFILELDGLDKGGDQLPTLRTVEGGGAKADVVSYQMGENGDIWRQLGKSKYEDIKLSLGLADATGFWAWIEEFLKGIHTRKNGAIVVADYNYCEKARREFHQAMIVSLGFPKWDANAKDQANITVTLAPEKVSFVAANGKKFAAPGKGEAAQKRIAACNFRFSIDGFEAQCLRTSKVDAFEVKVKTVEHHLGWGHDGARLEPLKIPGKIEYPNLVFYIPEMDAEPFRSLHNKHMDGKERDLGRTAKLSFYDNHKVDQGEFQFDGVHIFNVQSEKSDANSEDVKLVKVECAIEGFMKGSAVDPKGFKLF